MLRSLVGVRSFSPRAPTFYLGLLRFARIASLILYLTNFNINLHFIDKLFLKLVASQLYNIFDKKFLVVGVDGYQLCA